MSYLMKKGIRVILFCKVNHYDLNSLGWWLTAFFKTRKSCELVRHLKFFHALSF